MTRMIDPAGDMQDLDVPTAREAARQLTRISRKIRRRACDSEACGHGHCQGLIEAARIVRGERNELLHPSIKRPSGDA